MINFGIIKLTCCVNTQLMERISDLKGEKVLTKFDFDLLKVNIINTPIIIVIESVLRIKGGLTLKPD